MALPLRSGVSGESQSLVAHYHRKGRVDIRSLSRLQEEVMTPNDPNDLATLAWDEMAGLLRTHGVHEDEIFKSGKGFKAGFVKGFEAGYRHQEEKEPCVGFTQEEDEE